MPCGSLAYTQVNMNDAMCGSFLFQHEGYNIKSFYIRNYLTLHLFSSLMIYDHIPAYT